MMFFMPVQNYMFWKISKLTHKQTIMIYLKKMAIRRIIGIYKNIWSGIQGLVQCVVTAVRLLHWNKLD